MAGEFDAYVAQNPSGGDSWAYIQALLDNYGLGQLSDFAKKAIIDGLSANEIVQRLRTEPVYKERFKLIERRRELGLPAWSEAEVVQYEKSVTQLMRSAGFDQGFYDDPEDFVKFGESDLSVAEINTRINDGYVAAMNAPQDVRDEWTRMYGLTEAQLAMYMIDPERTEAVIMRQVGAVQRAAEAQRSGFGELSKDQSEWLSRMGVQQGASEQGFNSLTQQSQLMQTLPGEQNGDIDRDTQLRAAFGNDVAAQQRITRKGEERVAAFAGGGSIAQGKEGFAGAGSAR